MGMSPFVLPSVFTIKIAHPNQTKKKVKKQKLHYDAFVVQTARNLIHLLEAEESYVNSKLSNTDTTAAAEYNG